MKSIFLSIFLFLTYCFSYANPKANFWSQQRKGANSFNNFPLKERYKAAKDAGLEFLRITPSKWLNGRSKGELGDFLLGRPGTFQNIIQKDVTYLKAALDKADEVGIKIVLTVLSLPGNRWSQHNNGTQERKIWTNFKYHELSAKFWKQLATELKGHPAVAAYNIKNEPAPELGPKRFSDWYSGDYKKWYQSVKGTPQDLNMFYKSTVAAIREVDKETPIMIDSGFYGTPWAFKILEPVNDPNILYSFHMYEPYAYVNYRNEGKYQYPGKIPIGETGASEIRWNEQAISDFLKPLRDWAKKHKIDSGRIICGEFGVYRTQKGAPIYLDHQMKVYNRKGWHWASYSFREDDWAGMDYELGTAKPGWHYWKAIEQGKMPGPKTYNRKSELWDTIKANL